MLNKSHTHKTSDAVFDAQKALAGRISYDEDIAELMHAGAYTEKQAHSTLESRQANPDHHIHHPEIVQLKAELAAAQSEYAAGKADASQLWFQQSGLNLVINVLGTSGSVDIKKWFADDAAHTEQVTKIATSDSYLNTADVQGLVQAMASFSARHGAFDPSLTSVTSITNTSFGTLAATTTSEWHGYPRHCQRLHPDARPGGADRPCREARPTDCDSLSAGRFCLGRRHPAGYLEWRGYRKRTKAVSQWNVQPGFATHANPGSALWGAPVDGNCCPCPIPRHQ
jgi:hypothetical protein